MYITSIIFLYLVVILVGIFLYYNIKKVYNIISRPTDIGSDFIMFDFSKSMKKSGLPMIDFIVNGESQFFLVDSGANLNVIDTAYVNQNTELLSNHKKVNNVIESINGSAVSNQVIDLSFIFQQDEKNYTGFEDKFVVSDDITASFDAMGADSGFRPIGLLGSKFLEKYDWQIDYKNKCIWIPK